ncbi:hypothetical protein Tco_1068236 [Tanacetum coccineum]|uniref:Uncharacterized protein n=1 Tax=Tanacetum coccineum TaxID=301880 RepID=A0ABQ5HGI5_9ASTR
MERKLKQYRRVLEQRKIRLTNFLKERSYEELRISKVEYCTMRPTAETKEPYDSIIVDSFSSFKHAEYDESNTYVLERFNTTAGNPVKKILLKLNLSDHRLFKDGGGVKEVQRSFRHSDTERLSRSDEVLKLKNFKKDATLKLSKSTNQERYEHVGPEVASSQDGKVSRWRRDCAWLMISRCSRSQCQIQVQGTSSIQKSMITTTYSQENVKRTS